MPLPNKGISKAVKEAFINGTHEPDQMLVKLAHLNTDENRKAYIITLTKTLREKHGMHTKRNKRYNKRKTGAKASRQLTLNFAKQVHLNEEASPANLDMERLLKEWGSDKPTKIKEIEADRDYVTAEYIKKDDELRALQVKYDDLWDSVGELKREIVRLQVIVTYLEGKK